MPLLHSVCITWPHWALKGRMAFIAACVRRSFATATIFMALVICCVLVMPLMRLRSPRIFAMPSTSFGWDYFLKQLFECFNRLG